MQPDQDDPSAPLPSPWEEVRGANPGAILVRVINPQRGIQFWMSIERSARNLELGAELWDGATVIGSRPQDLGSLDLDTVELINAFDDAWHKTKNRQCLSTSPTTGAKA